MKSQQEELTGTAKPVRRRVHVVEDVAYARYGMSRGIVEADRDRDGARISCAVLAKGWPSWALAAKASGWRIMMIVLTNEEWLGFTSKWFEGTSVRLLKDLPTGYTWPAVDATFTDLDLASKLSMWSTVSSVIVMTRSTRRKPESWSVQLIGLSHVVCGGATDGEWKLNVYTPKSRSQVPVVVGRTSLRDLSGIISATSGRGVSCPPPKVTQMNLPEVIELRPNVFHGSGLMPFARRAAHYIVPNVFSVTNWVRRKLEAEETLLALDIPPEIITVLRSNQKASLCDDHGHVPLKCTLALVHAIGAQLFDTEASTVGDPGSEYGLTEENKGSGIDVAITNAAQRGQAIKAVKADDAEVPCWLWDNRVLRLSSDAHAPESIVQALDVCRGFFLRAWKRRVSREFQWWYHQEYAKWKPGATCVIWRAESQSYGWVGIDQLGLSCYKSALRRLRKASETDWLAGRDCIKRCMDATWWEWSGGSRPLYWRWPEDYRVQIRDGLPLWLKGPVAKWRVPQRPAKDPVTHEAMRKKLDAVRKRGYITKGHVESLTSFFAVPKGDSDIRMVYDGTKSGLNGTLWAPWFPLPTIDNHLRAVTHGYFMGDIDVGEMFLNFMMHPRIRVYCGVDLSRYFPEEISNGQVLWEVWERCGMGFTTSPFQTIQGILWAEEIILGDPSDSDNAFRWDYVQLNLPGMEGYDPSRPWVAKIRMSDGKISCDVFIYVDDVRVTGPTDAECWVASHQVASGLNRLGLQDAARKRRGPSQDPGAWAGSIVTTSDDNVYVLVSQERWDKTKSILRWIREEMSNDKGMDFKQLESYRGFLIYIVRTYPAAVPYLKGIHLTLDSWRPWRKNDGWKMTMKELRAAAGEKADDGEFASVSVNKAPKSVHPVPRLECDIDALDSLFSAAEPVKRLVRPSRTAVALYGFADASGKGFGSTLVIGGCLHYRHGQWASTVEDESSNYRELFNLVLAIEEANEQGLLRESELFMFTDNTTAEAAFHKGTSSSRRLFELVLRLRKVQMEGEVTIHVIHVAGTRMIAEGTDGLSRGSLAEGVMGGEAILNYVPLHLAAPERASQLKDWVQSWTDASDFKWLEPKDWFWGAHTCDHAIWTPAPAAADAALEQLGKAIHKRPLSTHIFLCPQLMTAQWRKQLGKICDTVLTLPVGTWFWDSSQHEPLILGIYLPLLPHRPWRFRGTLFVEQLEGVLSGVSAPDPDWGRDILREFLCESRRMVTLPECVVWRLLQGDRSRTVPNPRAGG